MKTCIDNLLVTFLLFLFCAQLNAAPIEVDSLSIEFRPDKFVRNLTHCYILKDSTLQIHTKHTNLPIKEVTDQCVVDSFITYARLFYIDQTAMYGEETIDIHIDYPYIKTRGYYKNKLVVGRTSYIFNAQYSTEYCRFTDMIVRLSKEYEQSKVEAVKHVVYSKDINKYDSQGHKTGKWITKYRHSIVEANYKSGKLHRVVKRYSYAGALQQLRHYRMGILIGPAYSFSGLGDMAIYKNIKKSEVPQAYWGIHGKNVPVNYTADEINYYDFGWSKQKKYYNDLSDYMHFAAYSRDSIPSFKSYHSIPMTNRNTMIRQRLDWSYNWYYTHKYYTHK